MARKAGGDRRPVKKKLADVRKAARAAKLAAQGKTYRQIAAELGWSKTMAHRAVRQLIDREKSEAVEAAVKSYVVYANAMLEGLAKKAFAGDPKAVTAACKALERASKFLGADRATKHELTGKDGAPLLDVTVLTDEQLEQLRHGAPLARAESSGGARAPASPPGIEPARPGAEAQPAPAAADATDADRRGS